MRKSTSTNYLNTQQLTANCPILSTMHLLNGRWKIAILWHLNAETHRFSTLLSQLPGISQKMLAQQLKELQQAGFIQKAVFAEVPPRTAYSLTGLGQSFIPVLTQIYAWGQANDMPGRVEAHHRKNQENSITS